MILRYSSSMSLNAELHRHLGGAVVPRIFWRYLHRSGHPLALEYPSFEPFEEFVTAPRRSLSENLELHTMVEQVQTLDTLAYFVSKLIRGAYIFESICYLELRHTPFYRTDPQRGLEDRIRQMQDVINIIDESARHSEYPIVFSQILCMHSRLPFDVNKAILDLADKNRDKVCGVDLAGPDIAYKQNLSDLIGLFSAARSMHVKTTGHLFETQNGWHPELLPYLDRIGHGIQIPINYPELLPEIAGRGQCLEVCPTTYLKTGTFQSLDELKVVFERCDAAGVDIVLCTDNAGLHNVRLPFEIENLLIQDIIDFRQLTKCQDASFRHAFAWPYAYPPQKFLARLSRES